MNRIKSWLLGLAAVVLPVTLVFSALVISNGVSAPSTVPGLDARPSTSTTSNARDVGDERPTPAKSSDSTTAVDDHSGRCSEPEHLSDPECISGSGSSGSDSSGSSGSSGPGGGDDSASSGSNSGPGGGDD